MLASSNRSINESVRMIVGCRVHKGRKWPVTCYRRLNWTSLCCWNTTSQSLNLTMATSQKLKFEDVSSGLYFFMFFVQCISQNIKKHKILDTLRKSGSWEVAVVKKHTIWTMATSQELVFEDVSSVLCFFIFVAQCISQNIKKHKKI